MQTNHNTTPIKEFKSQIETLYPYLKIEEHADHLSVNSLERNDSAEWYYDLITTLEIHNWSGNWDNDTLILTPFYIGEEISF
jgi:hypothetical protein